MYRVKLEHFEGPLDLLLFFVRKDELDIYDIPISRITKAYLEYIQLMQNLSLDIAGEFILMAATLMRIKAKMMLPPDPSMEEEEEMMDPREELSRRLIEYKQFKDASRSLSELDDYWRSVYRRTYFNFDLLPQETEAVGLKDVSFFDLLTAYKNALAKKPKIIYHNVERLNVTIEEQTEYIENFFRDRKCFIFSELCDDMSKIEVVVTFLALLDMIKKGEIAIRQTILFDDIWIYKAGDYEDEIPEDQLIPADAMTEFIEQSMISDDFQETEMNKAELEADKFLDTDLPLEEVADEFQSEEKVHSLNETSEVATGVPESIDAIDSADTTVYSMTNSENSEANITKESDSSNSVTVPETKLDDEVNEENKTNSAIDLVNESNVLDTSENTIIESQQETIEIPALVVPGEASQPLEDIHETGIEIRERVVESEIKSFPIQDDNVISSRVDTNETDLKSMESANKNSEISSTKVNTSAAGLEKTRILETVVESKAQKAKRELSEDVEKISKQIEEEKLRKNDLVKIVGASFTEEEIRPIVSKPFNRLDSVRKNVEISKNESQEAEAPKVSIFKEIVTKFFTFVRKFFGRKS